MAETATKTANALSKAQDQRNKQLGRAFTPLGEQDPIELSIELVRNFIAAPTKSGSKPTDRDVAQFIMLCQARLLNPWVGDAYMVGYDDSQKGPTYSLITSIYALLKRAEVHPGYQGHRTGIVVLDGKNELVHREGGITLKGETLIGGWAEVYREGHRHPYKGEVLFANYNKGQSVWKVDPQGMIQKVALARALRYGFPQETAGMYTEDERAEVIDMGAARVQQVTGPGLPAPADPDEALADAIGAPEDPPEQNGGAPQREAAEKPGERARAMPAPENGNGDGHDWVGKPGPNRTGHGKITQKTHEDLVVAIRAAHSTPEAFATSCGVECLADVTEEEAREYLADLEQQGIIGG